MPERTLAEVATAKRPSMIPGFQTAEEEAFDNWIEVRGPRKVEKLYFQQAAANDFAADDTYSSKLAHPYFATIVMVQDRNSVAQIGSVDLNSDESNANFKQLTLRNCETINGLGVLITVYGM